MKKWLQKILEERKNSGLSMEQANVIMQEIDREHKDAGLYIAPWEQETVDEPETEDGIACPYILGAKSLELGVRVWWDIVPNADGYYVYRKSANTEWMVVKKTKNQKGFFTDKTVRPNMTYQYAVEAFRDIGETRIFSSRENNEIQLRTIKQKAAD